MHFPSAVATVFYTKQVDVFPYLTSWCISLSKNQALVCVITLSKTTTDIIVQWNLIV